MLVTTGAAKRISLLTVALISIGGWGVAVAVLLAIGMMAMGVLVGVRVPGCAVPVADGGRALAVGLTCAVVGVWVGVSGTPDVEVGVEILVADDVGIGVSVESGLAVCVGSWVGGMVGVTVGVTVGVKVDTGDASIVITTPSLLLTAPIASLTINEKVIIVAADGARKLGIAMVGLLSPTGSPPVCTQLKLSGR